MTSRSHPVQSVALGLIKAYQYGVRPMLGPRCRFFPSCSEYTAEAISTYGVLRGSAMGALRLGKCHPWHAGGFDPVPPRGIDAHPAPGVEPATPVSHSNP